MHKQVKTGAKFHRWTVGLEASRGNSGARRWHATCECGTESIVDAYSLKIGNSRSCGCLKVEELVGRNLKHGRKRTPAYGVWASMIQRCEDKRSQFYSDYGGRGISVCKSWRSDFLKFLHDMGEPPEGMTLDRRDNNGNYSKRNCRWATRKQQANNRRSTRYLELNGVRRPLMEWAELRGLNPYTVRTRLRRGATDAEALTIAGTTAARGHG